MNLKYDRSLFRSLTFGLALCTTALLVDAPPPRAAETDVLTVQRAEGKLYAQPVKIAPVIEMLKQGDQVLMIHQKGDWYAVSLPDQRLGWAHHSIFTPETAAADAGAGPAAAPEAPEAASPGRPAALKVASGRVRTGPSLSSALAFGLTQGDRFTVLAEEGDWYQIQAENGQTGWVYHTLVDFLTPTETPAAEEGGDRPEPESPLTAAAAEPARDDAGGLPGDAGTPPDEMEETPGEAEEIEPEEPGAPADDLQADAGDATAPAEAPGAETAPAGDDVQAGAAEPGAAADGFDVIVRVRSGRVRSEPTTASPTMFGVTRGTRVRVTETEGSWYRIIGPDGRTGWSHMSLFEMAPEAAARPAADVDSSPSPPEARKILKKKSAEKSTQASAPAPAAAPEAAPAPREIRAIRFETTPEGHETIIFELDAFNPPKTYTLDDKGVPKVVCEFTDTRLSPGIGRDVPVNGKLVTAVSIRRPESGDPSVRVEASLDPRYKYSVDQVFFKKGNLYVMTFKK